MYSARANLLPIVFAADNTHRGFAFVEFLTKQEAKQAYDALVHTHFYGRHMVLEYAKADDTLEELRAKTKRKFQAGEDAAAASQGSVLEAELAPKTMDDHRI